MELDDADPAVRLRAAQALAATGDPTAIAELLQALELRASTLPPRLRATIADRLAECVSSFSRLCYAAAAVARATSRDHVAADCGVFIRACSPPLTSDPPRIFLWALADNLELWFPTPAALVECLVGASLPSDRDALIALLGHRPFSHFETG